MSRENHHVSTASAQLQPEHRTVPDSFSDQPTRRSKLFLTDMAGVDSSSWSASLCHQLKPEPTPLSGLASAFALQLGFYVHRFMTHPWQGDFYSRRRAALLGNLVTERSDGRDRALPAWFSSFWTRLGAALGPSSPRAGAPAGRSDSAHCNHHSFGILPRGCEVLQWLWLQALTSDGPGPQSGLSSFTACHPRQGVSLSNPPSVHLWDTHHPPHGLVVSVKASAWPSTCHVMNAQQVVAVSKTRHLQTPSSCCVEVTETIC